MGTVVIDISQQLLKRIEAYPQPRQEDFSTTRRIKMGNESMNHADRSEH